MLIIIHVHSKKIENIFLVLSCNHTKTSVVFNWMLMFSVWPHKKEVMFFLDVAKSLEKMIKFELHN